MSAGSRGWTGDEEVVPPEDVLPRPEEIALDVVSDAIEHQRGVFEQYPHGIYAT